MSAEEDAYAAAAGAHALLILTDWDEFARLDFKRIFDKMMKPAFVFDGRNLLDHAKLRAVGFEVFGIGQPEPPAEAQSAASPSRSGSSPSKLSDLGSLEHGA